LLLQRSHIEVFGLSRRYTFTFRRRYTFTFPSSLHLHLSVVATPSIAQAPVRLLAMPGAGAGTVANKPAKVVKREAKSTRSRSGWYVCRETSSTVNANYAAAASPAANARSNVTKVSATAPARTAHA